LFDKDIPLEDQKRMEKEYEEISKPEEPIYWPELGASVRYNQDSFNGPLDTVGIVTGYGFRHGVIMIDGIPGKSKTGYARAHGEYKEIK
jgi:hypothetical protein